MTLIFQDRITERDLRLNPQVIYLYGDNTLRTGLGGQAKVMRGKPNTWGIATKWIPTTEPHAFFKDEQFDQIEPIIRKDFRPVILHVAKGGVVICPADGLGTGLADLPKRAPRVLDLIRAQLRLLV